MLKLKLKLKLKTKSDSISVEIFPLFVVGRSIVTLIVKGGV